jgi:hypothetical protein
MGCSTPKVSVNFVVSVISAGPSGSRRPSGSPRR